MFDLDPSKMLLVGAVALMVVGPKELPQVLRALGQAVGKLRRFQADARRVTTRFIAEADLDAVGKDFAAVEKSVRTNLALNPATAMRGTLVRSGAGAAAGEGGEMQYLSPEMKAYLSPASGSALPAQDAGATDPQRPG